MKNHKLLLFILTGQLLASGLAAQTADDLVSAGRACLVAHDLTGAYSNFNAAVTMSPTNEAANALAAVTRILVLPQQPAGSNLLNSFGFSVNGRDVYNWTSTFPHDISGNTVFPTNNTSVAIAFYRTNIMVALAASRTNLTQITDPNFTLSLTAAETSIESVTVDYGDFLLLQALERATEFAGYTLNAHNFNFVISHLHDLDKTNGLTIQRVLSDYPSLLNLSNTTDLATSKGVFTNAIVLYQQASDFIRNVRPPGAVRLFNLEPDDLAKEATFRALLTNVLLSLNTPTELSPSNANAIASTAYFGAYFSGAHSLRSLMPQFYGNAYVNDTLPDYTFGGIVPDWPAYETEAGLRKMFHSYAGIYGGLVYDLTFNDPDAGMFGVLVSTNGQVTVVGYDVDSFQNIDGSQSGGVAAQFNVDPHGNWQFNSNSVAGVSGYGSIGKDGSFNGELDFTNGDSVQLDGFQPSLQSPLGPFQNAAGGYSGTWSGTFNGQAQSGTLLAGLDANGYIVFCVFHGGAQNDGGLGLFGSNNQFTTTDTASGSTVSGTLTNATLKIGGKVSNSNGSGTFTLSRSTFVPFDVPPAITTSLPLALNALLGTNVTLSLVTTGSPPMCYQWYFNGIAIPNATNNTLVVSNLQYSSAGTYSVTINNAVGGTNATVALTIDALDTDVTFNITPSAVSNTYTGMITLQVAGLNSNETVIVQKFLDLNTNGVIDGNDWLVQQFSLTDGQAGMVIGGVTNFNVPGDVDSVPGQITAPLNFQNGDIMQNISGKYLYKLSSPVGLFTPITNQFVVTNFPYAQKFTGNVVSNGTSITMPNALVLLCQPQPFNGGPWEGVVANNAGSYTMLAPPGTYSLVAFSSNYVANMGTPPVLTLNGGQTLTTNLTVTHATASISGTNVDANNSSIRLPGVMVFAQSANGLTAVTFTDTNGNFKVPVTAGAWGIKASAESLLVHGYLVANGTTVTAGTTGVTLAVPKATALIYGTVTDNLGNPFAGIDVYADENNNNLYETDVYTDANGNYVLGVFDLGADDSWWMEANGDSQLTNYIFSEETIAGNINAGQAVLQNFTGILATNYITGWLKDNYGNPIAGVGVSADGVINDIYYHNYVETSVNGTYSLNVGNGTWDVYVNSYGGDGSLSGNYLPPADQTVVIANNNGIANFTAQTNINVGGSLQVTTAALPNGAIGTAYDQQLTADGGYTGSPYSWSVYSGSLPPGLSMDSGGTIQGTPTASGLFSFTVQVTDQNNNEATKALSLNILMPLQVTTTSLPNGTNNAAYSQTLAASGGQTPYSWTKISGALPAGLTLATNGLISGTPTTNGIFNFTAQVTDAYSSTAAQALALTIIYVDKIPPVLAITNITGGMLVSNASFTVMGTATDNVAVAAVYYSLSNAVIKTGFALAATANNWANWSTNVTLTPGTNTIRAYAVDTSGNISTTNTVIFDYVPSAILTVSTNGLGSLNPNYNGALLQIGKSYSITATAGTGFTFANWTSGTNLPLTIITNGTTVQFLMVSNLMLQANFVDTSKPTLSITNLTAGQRVSNAVFTVKGTASDNWQVGNVVCQINGGGWNSATNLNNWTNWTAGVTLTPGTNIVQAFAVDTSGNVSTTNSVSVQFVVTNQLQIHAIGLGTISPNYSNAWLNIGQNYSITSAPASGFVFTKWVISTNWSGGTTTSKTNLMFMMASNLTLQVTFADVTKPTLAITAPTAGQHMTNALATVVGTASDNWKVSAVWYQLTNRILTGGKWSLATTTNNYTNWTTIVTLAAGTNTVKAYAVDLGGNYSTTSSVSVLSSNTFKLQLNFALSQPLTSTGLNFTLQISSNLDGHIQVSTNLFNWVTLTNFVGTNTTLNFRDPAATNSNSRFYRAVIP